MRDKSSPKVGRFASEEEATCPSVSMGVGRKRWFFTEGREAGAAALLAVGKLSCPSPSRAGVAWEMVGLEEWGCFVSTQHLEPIPAPELSCERTPLGMW